MKNINNPGVSLNNKIDTLSHLLERSFKEEKHCIFDYQEYQDKRIECCGECSQCIKKVLVC